MMSRQEQAIVIVAKQPEAGRVKTRLCPPLTLAQAADLAHAFLDDTIARSVQVADTDVFLGFAPDKAAFWFASAYPGMRRLSQGEGDLGARLTGLSDGVFASGYRRVVLIGADTPFLSVEHLQQALASLQTPYTVALGPAVDGGYYLVGLTRPSPWLFDSISWSSEVVLQQTLGRAAAVGQEVHLLLSERDVDTPEDLAWLLQHRDRLDPSSRTALLLREQVGGANNICCCFRLLPGIS